jgi:TRAP-type C4-dicarboxylate transport system substrate-binding protein
MFKKTTAVLMAALLGSLQATAALATTTIKIATLAPQDSPWGKEFKRWAKDVSDDTGGEAQLDFQWNGQAGDESLMVQKMRSGQIDGAAVTPLGLGQTGVSDVLLFTLPGLFANWQKLDAVRDALKDDLDKQFQQKGFTVVGWGDVGALKEMSVGFEIHHPTDLRGHSLFFYNGDPITPKVYAAIGGITARQMGVMEVLPSLSTHAVDVVMAPPLGAEQLQWSSRVDTISTQTLAFAIGAILMSSARLAALPPKIRDVVLARGAETATRLTKSIRNIDGAAFARMKQTKHAYDPTPQDVSEWREVFKKVAQELRGSVFTPALFDKVVQLADNPLAK